jgi:hypothetical protein
MRSRVGLWLRGLSQSLDPGLQENHLLVTPLKRHPADDARQARLLRALGHGVAV